MGKRKRNKTRGKKGGGAFGGARKKESPADMADFQREKGKVLAAISRQMEEREFESEEEMQAYFQENFAGKDFDEILANEPEDESPHGRAMVELDKIHSE